MAPLLILGRRVTVEHVRALLESMTEDGDPAEDCCGSGKKGMAANQADDMLPLPPSLADILAEELDLAPTANADVARCYPVWSGFFAFSRRESSLARRRQPMRLGAAGKGPEKHNDLEHAPGPLCNPSCAVEEPCRSTRRTAPPATTHEAGRGGSAAQPSCRTETVSSMP